MNIGPREHITWDMDVDIDDDTFCIHNWDGEYPGEDDTPYMLEDDTPEVTTLDDDLPF